MATLAFLPVMIMFLNAEWLLLKLGQDPQISKLAKSYLTMIIPGIWSQIMFDATKKFHSA